MTANSRARFRTISSVTVPRPFPWRLNFPCSMCLVFIFQSELTSKPQEENIKLQTPSSKHQTPNTKPPNTKPPNTKHQTPNTKHQTPNTKCQMPKFKL